MNIYCVNENHAVQLGSIWLTQIKPFRMWKAKLASIRDGRKLCLYCVDHRGGPPEGLTDDRTSFSKRRIGCCEFSQKDWSVIAKAIQKAQRKEALMTVKRHGKPKPAPAKPKPPR